jgi:hypothetical protein
MIYISFCELELHNGDAGKPHGKIPTEKIPTERTAYSALEIVGWPEGYLGNL